MGRDYTGNVFDDLVLAYGGANLPALTADEEQRLLEVVRTQGPDSAAGSRAVETLIARNLGFVVARVRKWPADAAGDLFPAGVEGLWQGILRYDPAYAARLITYAVGYIDQRIRVAWIERQGYTLSKYLTMRDVRVAAETYRAEHGRYPTVGELEAATGRRFREGTVRGALALAGETLTLDEPGAGGGTLAEAVAAPAEDYGHLDGERVAELLEEWLGAELTPRNVEIFKAVAMDPRGSKDKHMAETARTHGITRERVRQIKHAVRARLLKSTHPAARKLREIWREDI